jgi:hypothetical protein
MMKPAGFGPCDHAPPGLLNCPSLGCILDQREMRPGTVVVPNVLPWEPPEVRLVRHDYVILIQEATVDCYNESEERTGLHD